MTAGVVGALAEALAQHREGSAWVVSSGANQLTVMEYCCGCGWRVRGAWADGSPHLAHVASVVAALPNIAIVPNEGTTRRYSAAYRNFDGDIVPVGVTYSKRAWAEEVRIEWQRDEPNGKYFIVYRDVPAWQEADL